LFVGPKNPFDGVASQFTKQFDALALPTEPAAVSFHADLLAKLDGDIAAAHEAHLLNDAAAVCRAAPACAPPVLGADCPNMEVAEAGAA
jgi:hypothetical protein